MKALTIFDYMYYKIGGYFIKDISKDNISYTAVVIVSLSQVLIVLDITGFFLLEFLNHKERSELLNDSFPFFLIFMLIISLLNDYKYKGRYTSYHEKWKDDNEKSKTIKDTIIILLIVLPLIFIPILLNVKDYNI